MVGKTYLLTCMFKYNTLLYHILYYNIQLNALDKFSIQVYKVGERRCAVSDTEQTLEQDQQPWKAETGFSPEQEKQFVIHLEQLYNDTNAKLESKKKAQQDLEKEIASLERTKESTVGLLNAIRGIDPLTDTSIKKRLRKLPETLEVVIPILEERGHPMHYREIYSALEERGFEIQGQDPGNSLLARLISTNLITRVGRGFYTLAKQPDTDKNTPTT